MTLKYSSENILPSLPKDPHPEIERIDELARRVLKGDILLPLFQRGFVWNKKQIINLLDSIAKGYPIGSMLLWESSSQELKSEREIADLDVTLPKPGYPVNYLLDGQQRLSTICGSLFWKPDFNPKSRWNIVCDLREERFFHLDTLADPPIHQIRVSKLSDPQKFFSHFSNLAEPPNDLPILLNRLNSLFNRFKDYKIPVVTIGDLPVEDVAKIFERLNSTGTPLTLVDLMRAATWRPDFDLQRQLESIQSGVIGKQFDKVEPLILLRNISAAAGGEFYSESITLLRKRDSCELKKAVKDVEKALKLAVDFLSNQLGILSYELVPYANQVTVLTEIFRRIPRPSLPQNQAINEWFWKTSLSGYFTGWSTGAMKADLQAIRDFSEGRTEKIILYATPPTYEIWKVRPFGLKFAHSKLLALILTQQHPLDILDGKKVDTTKALAWDNAKEYHHFFPRAYLKQKGKQKSQINCLANYILISSASNKELSAHPPSVYLAKVRERAGYKLAEWLKSNFITKEAFEAALCDDFDTFIDIRARTLHEFVIGKTDWVESDSSYSDQELESPEVEDIQPLD